MRHVPLLAALSLCLVSPLALGACLEPTEEDDEGAKAGGTCKEQPDCQSGLPCVDGVCRAPCDPGADEEGCKDDERCVEVPDSGVAGACLPIGGLNLPCDGETNACQEGENFLCVISSDDDTGYCRAPCDPGDPDCPEDFACASLQGGGGACVPAES